jgi:hypothetical protein
MIALLTLAATLAVSSAQTSPAPVATPNTADVVPEIGRTKSKAPACAVLQDLVMPAFDAALRADKQFAGATPQFSAYAAAKDATAAPNSGLAHASGDGITDVGVKSRRVSEEQDSPTPDMFLARLDTALVAMRKDLLAIGKALGDPRVSKDSLDPAVQSERQNLLALWAVQAARIATLEEFLERQRLDRAKTTLSQVDMSPFFKGGVGGNRADDLAAKAAAALDSGHVPLLFGQPMISGIASNDRQSVNDWTGGMTRNMREVENDAAISFLGVANTCK